MKISVSHSAFNDLASILEHYTAEGVPHIGQGFAREIIQHIQVLSAHPDAGRIVPEFQQTHIREVIHPPFRVVYMREKSAIKVIRVWRSERLLVLPDK
jgi:plasmid stabilization system protein ParE